MNYGLTQNAFERAMWYPNGRVNTEGAKLIRVEVVTDVQKRFGTLVRGLIKDESSTVIRTAYCYDYSPTDIKQEIFFRDRYYGISGVGEDTQSVNPQARGLIHNAGTVKILELKEKN
ncbi:MAG: hypothetical protein LBT55_01715 [Clostridiaceae bacterium]|jgi:hypothetical protein|nr:hypothetical protein [Clostridiaceae bacterium]